MPECNINLSFFKQNSFGEVSLYRELLEIFLKTTPEMLAHLKQMAEQNDFTTVGKIAHKLKSNVQSVELNNIYDLLDDFEAQKYSNKDDANFQSALYNIIECCNIAVLKVEEEMKLLQN